MLTELVERMKLRGLSPDRYRVALATYEEWCKKRNQKPTSPAAGFAYRRHLMEEGASVGQVNRTISMISAAVKTGVKEGEIPAWVAQRFALLRLRQNQIPQPLIDVEGIEDFLPESPKEVRDRAMIAVFLDTGCTMSDLRAMRWGDVKDGKWKERFLSAETWSALQEWYDAQPVDTDIVWSGWAGRNRPTAKLVNARAIWKVVKDRAAFMGIEGASPQAIRRVYLTREVERLGPDLVTQIYGISRRQAGYLQTNARRQNG